MNIDIYTRGGEYFTQDHYKELKAQADRLGFRLSFSSEVAQSLDFEVEGINQQIAHDADILISYGGDGTLLAAVAQLKGRKIPILGINSGHMGFLTTNSHEGIADILDCLQKGEYTIQQRSLIEVEGDFDSENNFPYAFNEFSIQKDGMSMVDIELWAGDIFVAKYMADGVIFSTPSGSTAYSLSVGGAILSPSCQNFIITPIAAHNLNIRPVVVPDDREYHVKVASRSKHVLATLDNRTYYTTSQSRFTIRRAKMCVEIIKLHNESFFDTLRRKMMWGYDGRSK